MRTDQLVGTGRPHVLHALLLSFPVALFPAALVTDIAYLKTAQIQWTNFSAWLIAGAMVFVGLVLAWSLVRLVLGYRGPERTPRLIYTVVLAVLFVLGLINSLKHSQDGWSSVGAFGLTLSILCALLAVGAGLLAHLGSTVREDAR